MSSALRSHGAISQTTKFHHIKTVGYYNDVVGSTFPVPFIYSNGTLDINLEDSVEASLIDAETAGTEYIRGLCKDMGGIGLVQHLGPNFIRWLNNWVADHYDDNSVIDTFSVYVPATVTKVQVTDEDDDDFEVLENDIDDEPWGISLRAPKGDGFVSGSSGNNFHTCWVFKTPLTIKFLLNGSPRYLTYYTVFAPVYD
jgi:hypothetical protein